MCAYVGMLECAPSHSNACRFAGAILTLVLARPTRQHQRIHIHIDTHAPRTYRCTQTYRDKHMDTQKKTQAPAHRQTYTQPHGHTAHGHANESSHAHARARTHTYTCSTCLVNCMEKRLVCAVLYCLHVLFISHTSIPTGLDVCSFARV